MLRNLCKICGVAFILTSCLINMREDKLRKKIDKGCDSYDMCLSLKKEAEVNFKNCIENCCVQAENLKKANELLKPWAKLKEEIY